MSFKVSFNSGTGRDDLDKENEVGEYREPFILEFDTREERESFLIGIDMAKTAMDGWEDAWVETKYIDN